MLDTLIQDISQRDAKTLATFGVGFLIMVLLFRGRSKYKLPPGPMGIPILGNVLQMMGKQGLSEIFRDWSRKYGNVFRIQAGSRTMVILNKWDVVKEALIQRQDDFAGRPRIPSFIYILEGGKDIMMNDYGTVWKFHRKLASSAIRTYASDQHLEDLVQYSLKCMFERLDQVTGPVDMREHFAMLAFNVGFSTCYGKMFSYDDPDFIKNNNLTREITEIMGNGLPEDLFPILEYFPSNKRRLFREGIQSMLDMMKTCYYEAKEQLNEDNPRCLVDHMLLAQKKKKKKQKAASATLR